MQRNNAALLKTDYALIERLLKEPQVQKQTQSANSGLYESKRKSEEAREKDILDDTSTPTEIAFEEDHDVELRTREAALYEWFDTGCCLSLAPSLYNREQALWVREQAVRIAKDDESTSIPDSINTDDIPDGDEIGGIALCDAGDAKRKTRVVVPCLVDVPEGAFCRIRR